MFLQTSFAGSFESATVDDYTSMVQRFFNSVQRLVKFAEDNYKSGRHWKEVSVPVEWNAKMQVRDYKPQNDSAFMDL